MRSTVYLLRHGKPEGGSRYRGVTDDPLSPAGWAQMRRAVVGIVELDRIVTSPLRRCAAFAECLSSERGVPLAVEPGFRELDFGDWEGRTPHELHAACPDALRRFRSDPVRHAPPGGEAVHDYLRSVLTAWKRTLADLDGERLLLVVHGGTIRAIVGHLRGLAAGELLRIQVPFASLHRLAVDHDGHVTELAPAS